jgi:hypothetical protein
MSDPVASLRDRAGILGMALAQWAERGTAPDQAAARRAASTAVDAIDALLGDLYLLRGRLVQEIRQAEAPARCRVARAGNDQDRQGPDVHPRPASAGAGEGCPPPPGANGSSPAAGERCPPSLSLPGGYAHREKPGGWAAGR